jgi:hypothetical protein
MKSISQFPIPIAVSLPISFYINVSFVFAISGVEVTHDG